MRRVALCAIIVALTPLLVAFTWPGTVEWLCTRGIKQYNAGDFRKAGESFEHALEPDPGNATLQFNRGAALYREESYAEAAEAFTSATSSGDGQLGTDAAYNLGNAQFRAGDYKSAIEAYKQALRRDPADAQAKYNLELALRKQQEKEQQEQQQQQQQSDQNQEDQQDEQQNDQQQQQDQQQDQQQQSQQDQQQQSDEQQQKDQQQSQEQRTEDGELSEAQARRLLHALASQDAEMQKLIRRVPQRRQPAEGEKDW